MKYIKYKYLQYILLLIVFIALAMPIILNWAPAYWGTPDIQYVKAKTIRVMEGDIFADPVTGITNYHPPWYHVFLSVFVRLGITLDTLLILIALLNTALTIYLTYLIGNHLWDKWVGLFVAMSIPFIQKFMGPGYMFLATAYYFSFPIYLLGLYLYLKRYVSMYWCLIWAAAFIISPVYVFIIGLTFAYELILVRKYKYILPGIAAFAVAIVPFYIQTYIIYHSGLEGTAAFAIWRGLPDLKQLAPRSLQGWVAILAYAIVIYAMIRYRKVPVIIYISALATALTSYHFNPEYASRIIFIFSIFAIGYTFYCFKDKIIIAALFLSAITIIGLTTTVEHQILLYSAHNKIAPIYKIQSRLFHERLPSYIKPNECILAYHDTYRYLILPYFPIYGLVAYKSGEYFQLNGTIAQNMLNDYESAIGTDSIRLINSICDKYDIATAVIYGSRDMSMTGLKTVADNWTLVYGDSYFRIYKKPI